MHKRLCLYASGPGVFKRRARPAADGACYHSDARTATNQMAAPNSLSSTVLAPLRHAVAWIVYASMRAVVLLPLRAQLGLGRALGRLVRRLAPSRRRIVRRNLELCMPELDAAERERLEAGHFEALGASVVEMAMGWFGSFETISRHVRIEGGEHLAAALEQGRGVILYSAHWTAFEFAFPVVATLCPRLCGMYKPQRNAVMNRVMECGRGRSFDRLFDKDSVRDMIFELRGNAVVWYASDQSYWGKSSAVIPFFGEPAMTNTSISRIARVSGAAVLPYACRRLADDSGYVVTIAPPLADFPTRDAEADTRRLVGVIEEFVRRCPEQYWWIHQRFKRRPAPYRDAYAD